MMRRRPHIGTARVACATLLVANAMVLADVRVGFEADTSSALESVGSVSFPVVLSRATNQAVTVEYAVTGGSAKKGDDYTLNAGTLTIDPGTVTGLIACGISNDSDWEANETVVVRIQGPAGAALGSRVSHMFTIVDDDAIGGNPNPPKVSFESSTSSGGEGDTPASLQVLLSWPGMTAGRVDYSVSDHSAKAGLDYTLSSGTLMFSAGVDRQPIEIPIVGDEVSESNETFIVTLENPVDLELGSILSHTYHIIDDDTVKVAFVEAEMTVKEAVRTPQEVGVAVQGESDLPVTVLYTTSGTARRDIDYVTEPIEELTFDPRVTNQVISVTMLDDTEVEDEEIHLTLLNPGNAILGELWRSKITVEDNDEDLPTLVIEPATSTTTPKPTAPGRQGERFDRRNFRGGSEDITNITFDVTLSATSAVDVLLYFTAGGTAVLGQDYTIGLTNPIVIPAGDSNVLIHIGIEDDGEAEGDKEIRVTFTNSVNVDLAGEASFSYWIMDNDSGFEQLTLFKQEVATVVSGEVLTVLGPKAQTIRPRGLAVDKAGNYYISDQGADPKLANGGILMWPADRNHVIRIMRGLDHPSDIELTTDGRQLVIAGPEGAIIRQFLGVSVRLMGVDPRVGNTVVFVRTSLETLQATVSEDGYFHILNVMTDGMTDDSVDIIVEHAGKTKVFERVPLEQPGLGEISGHRVVNLSL